ncbi:hypothetical protein ELE36_16620 [Pseudolysobacter antarcticus]|uniref:Transmembrane protein n=1 Tax=Pseudolysobacter antarcticus TaxID=2511995 RepID=A0A411HMZ1_9GAMM|nr:hypothetical protein [Pseudolysobacter antarcticus]QBB71847.1 hypothetical protein ELE36_16620 [Pseudolysobacter antarcticus]
MDSSWTEVLAWAALRHLHWGRDIVFTYGPLGFLHGGTSYVPGILSAYITGQVLLSTAFVAITAYLLRRAHLAMFAFFAAAYTASFLWIAADVAWALIFLFGTTIVIDSRTSIGNFRSLVLLTTLSVIFASIALIKFSLFPLWILCVLVLLADSLIVGSTRRALFIVVVFPAVLLLTWLACAQDIGDFPLYLRTSFEVAAGYGNAMGMSAPPLVGITGATCMVMLGALCVFAAYRCRRDASTLVILVVYLAAAFLTWRANFTRADHAPWFFTYFSVMPFGLLCYRPTAAIKPMRIGLILLILISTAPALIDGNDVVSRWPQAWTEIGWHANTLMHLPELQTRRDMEWQALQKHTELPRIKQRIGASSVDMFTVSQGILLSNDLNYTPRPVFQSYSAYTPYLARLNETWLLGAQAPAFVVMQLQTIDGHLPLSEDPLAFIALLQHYRPAFMEHDILLLERDKTARALPVVAPASWLHKKLGEQISLDNVSKQLALAFIKVDLTPLGQIFTALLREPPLKIVVTTAAGEYAYRFLRLTGASGFVLSPLISSTQDWVSLQLSMPVAPVLGFRIEPETPWQRLFFEDDLQVGFEQRDYLHLTADNTSVDLASFVYPGFNLMPTEKHGEGDIILDDEKKALFIHAPGHLRFSPTAATYRVSGEFGVQASALTNHACDTADGVGMSVIRLRENVESQLLHIELDPWHVAQDRGAHRFEVKDVSLELGDKIEYRIDPGHAGSNTICDWSYVRDLKFDAQNGDSSP